MKRDAEHQMRRILEFEAKINAYFRMIKQRKWNSNITFWGGTLDIPLALPLVIAYLRCLGLRMNFKSVLSARQKTIFLWYNAIHPWCMHPGQSPAHADSCFCGRLYAHGSTIPVILLCLLHMKPILWLWHPFVRSKGFAQLLLYPSFVDTTPVLSKGVTDTLLIGAWSSMAGLPVDSGGAFISHGK